MTDPFTFFSYPYDHSDSNHQENNGWLCEDSDYRGDYKLGAYPSFDYVPHPDVEDKNANLSTGVSLFQELYKNKTEVPPLENQLNSQPICQEVLDTGKEKEKQDTRRQKRTIEISNTMAVYRKSRVEKGDRFQTKNLCKNLHTETTNFLKDLTIVGHFGAEEVGHIKEFCRANVSIETFKALLNNANINACVKEFYRSKEFIKVIMGSKMEMRAKLIMLKYLEKILSITYDPNFKAWKKDSKEFL